MSEDKPKLLILEDDDGLRRQYRWALSDYTLFLSGTRAEALELMRSAHGDLLALSEAGQGTIMRIVLPVESPPASALPLNEPKVLGMTS